MDQNLLVTTTQPIYSPHDSLALSTNTNDEATLAPSHVPYLPMELIAEIIGKLAIQNPAYVYDWAKFPSTFLENIRALCNLCLVQRRFCELAQPVLFASAGQGALCPGVYIDDTQSQNSRFLTVLLVVRTLLARPDLRRFTRLLYVENMLEWGTDDPIRWSTAASITLREEFLGIFFDIEVITSLEPTEKPVIVASTQQRGYEAEFGRILRRAIETSTKLPLQTVLSRKELGALVKHVSGMHFGLAATLLRSALAGCVGSWNWILMSLTSGVEELHLRKMGQGVNIAQCHWARIIESGLGPQTFRRLRRVTLHELPTSKIIRSSRLTIAVLLTLPSLIELIYHRTRIHPKETEELQKLKGTSKLASLKLRGAFTPEYVAALISACRGLISFDYEHDVDPGNTFTSVGHSFYPQGLCTSTLAVALDAHSGSLFFLTLHCPKRCQGCNRWVSFAEFHQLRHLSIDANLIGFETTIVWGRGSEICASLPKGLEYLNLTLMANPWIDHIIPHVVKDFGTFLSYGMSARMFEKMKRLTFTRLDPSTLVDLDEQIYVRSAADVRAVTLLVKCFAYCNQTYVGSQFEVVYIPTPTVGSDGNWELEETVLEDMALEEQEEWTGRSTSSFTIV